MPRLMVELDAPTIAAKGGWPKYVALELEGGETVKFAAQFRRCGKSNCSTCPHGPYAFAVIGSGDRKRRIQLGPLPAGSPLAPPRTKKRRRRP